MTTQLRQGIDQSKPEVTLSEVVECDEVDVTAGHNGNPEEDKKRRKGKRNRLKGIRLRYQTTSGFNYFALRDVQ